MGPVGVVATAAVGLGAGWLVGPVADRIATPRYGADSAGHDPEDLELALLAAPTTPRTRMAATFLTGAAYSLLAGEFVDVEVVAFFAAFTWLYVVAAVIDLQYLRLPDVITYPAAALAIAGSLAMAAHFDHVEGAVNGIIAAAVATAVLWGVSLLFVVLRGKEAFGLGDVKLQLSLGASAGWLGWSDELPLAGPVTIVIWVALAGFVIGSLAGLPAAGFRVSRHIPFGPFLMLGWFVVVLFADALRP